MEAQLSTRRKIAILSLAGVIIGSAGCKRQGSSDQKSDQKMNSRTRVTPEHKNPSVREITSAETTPNQETPDKIMSRAIPTWEAINEVERQRAVKIVTNITTKIQSVINEKPLTQTEFSRLISQNLRRFRSDFIGRLHDSDFWSDLSNGVIANTNAFMINLPGNTWICGNRLQIPEFLKARSLNARQAYETCSQYLEVKYPKGAALTVADLKRDLKSNALKQTPDLLLEPTAHWVAQQILRQGGSIETHSNKKIQILGGVIDYS